LAELHPFLVHFPIVLATVAFLFDAFAAWRKQVMYHRTAFILQVGGALAALPAAFSGNLAESVVRSNGELTQAIGMYLDRHTSLGNILVWFIILFAIARVFAVLEKKSWALSGWVFPGAACLLAGFAIVTALAGGELSSAILEYFINR
jgi:uncharacterized membrane protein